MTRRLPALVVAVAVAAGGAARAGHNVPSYIDGCRSADGRYTVTAELAPDSPPKGPFKWRYVWTDAKENVTRRYDAAGVPGGQVYGNLFVPPGGETFALFNNVVMYSPKKLGDHHATDIPPGDGGPAWRAREIFTNRLVVYRSADGSVLKEYGVNDILKPEEWPAVSLLFTRVHWVREYPGLSFRTTPRSGYAFYRVSPDYSVLEFKVVAPRGKGPKAAGERVVRVSLVDGRVLAADETLPPEKTPARPFVGPDKLPADGAPNVHDRYVPSLDPVRTPGAVAPAAADKPKPVAGGPTSNP